jgi:hypothetical protein
VKISVVSFAITLLAAPAAASDIELINRALVHAKQRRVRVYLFTDDVGWEHARMLVYRGGKAHVVEFPKPMMMVVDDHIVDVGQKLVTDRKLAQHYLIDFIGLTMKAIDEENTLSW